VRSFSAIDRKNRIIHHKSSFIEDFTIGFWSQLPNECECAISKRIHRTDFEIIIFNEHVLSEIYDSQHPKNICCDVQGLTS